MLINTRFGFMREKEFLPLISDKLGIDTLNAMQQTMLRRASEKGDVILLSPTGSGKTLAFLLPVMRLLKAPTGRVQCVIIAPSRELVIQIGNVAKAIADGYKVTSLYGGHSVTDEVKSLGICPDIIVATPGRLLDHIHRRNIDVMPARILVLDEFDKSLELGFSEDMKKIVGHLKNVSRTILTSATRGDIPEFIKLDEPVTLDYLAENKELRTRLKVHEVRSDNRDKLQSLLSLLRTTGVGEGVIVFVNHRESAERVASFLGENGADCVLYSGVLRQEDREKALARFNNGSRTILVATDLAARGLDITGVGSVVHYHQATSKEAFTHRNGRTARVGRSGDVYVMLGPDEKVEEFTTFDDKTELSASAGAVLRSSRETLHIAEGRKEKLSRGDIAGFLIKEGGLDAGEVGKIDVFDHYSLVAVPREKAEELVKKLSRLKIKGRKRRIRIAN